ncbi:MAG TPA: hypothetical protein VFJ90_17060, partial [Candidatus Didemnitutus sp.]|nr:hypothetical protein [Candidatus Didemnitutus sp.]
IKRALESRELITRAVTIRMHFRIATQLFSHRWRCFFRTIDEIKTEIRTPKNPRVRAHEHALVGLSLGFFLSGKPPCETFSSSTALRTKSPNNLPNNPTVDSLRRVKLLGWITFFVLAMTGCTSVNTHSWSKSDLHSFKHVYVETASNDSAQIDAMIARELQKLGFDASSGVRTMRPDNAELLVTYDGQWEWDFRLYLIQLNLTVRSVRDGQQLATARIVHPGVTSKSPEAMVREVLTPLFGVKK